ncbi:hypothetical protein KKG72_07355 [bacterium]|nr:hypothetical protein [bacterium]MBU1994064.1 hypothetical protein [bacterium]
MLKKLTPFFIVLIIVFIIVFIFLSLASKQNMTTIKEGNLQRLPLEMVPNKYQDSDCGMVIEDLTYASQVVAKNGKTWFFHDHGGFIHWFKDKNFENEAIIWVMSKDTKKWINGKKAYYSLTDKTPMGYGFGAYEKQGKEYVDYETMKLKMLRGETLNNPYIKQQLLGR